MNVDTLWASMPAALRIRDEEAGGLLRALFEVLAEPAVELDEQIGQLQDDWFIETCAEWVVPYLGDLFGTRALHSLSGSAGFSNRARVADTLRFRRRKGTAAMLEELARVTTGWRAHAVEMFETLSTTQHVNHVRPGAPATALVREAGALELVRGPFDRTPHTVDVRSMNPVNGWHSLPNVGLFVWPVPSYPLDRATAVPVADPPDGRWFVDPLGVDHPMSGATVVESSIDQRSDESNVPAPLRRRPLRDELNARRTPPAAGSTAPVRWFTDDDPAVVVWIQPTPAAPLDPVQLTNLFVCDLTDWAQPTGSLVRLDPVLGRIAVAPDRAVHRLAVSWSYATSGDVGAGSYPRRDPAARSQAAPDWQIGVSATDRPVPNAVVGTLADAVDAWHGWQAGHPSTVGRIVMMDSHRYQESFTGPNRIEVGQGSRLSILAARWPAPTDGPRVVADVDPAGVRPCLVGDVEVAGIGTGDRAGELIVDGLLLSGDVVVVSPPAGADGLGRLELRSSTVVPTAGGVTVSAGNDRVAVALHRCVTGALTLAGDGIDVELVESVLDSAAGAGSPAVTAPGADLTADGVTVLGTAAVRSLAATDCIFDDLLTVTRRQQGCVRFSYITPDSVTPRRYRCQPDLAAKAAPGDPTVSARLEPAYLSDESGNAGYARLAEHAAVELRTGAESGAELGVYRFLLTPQRVANLLSALGEYLPFDRVAAPLPVVPIEGDRP